MLESVVGGVLVGGALGSFVAHNTHTTTPLRHLTNAQLLADVLVVSALDPALLSTNLTALHTLHPVVPLVSGAMVGAGVGAVVRCHRRPVRPVPLDMLKEVAKHVASAASGAVLVSSAVSRIDPLLLSVLTTHAPALPVLSPLIARGALVAAACAGHVAAVRLLSSIPRWRLPTPRQHFANALAMFGLGRTAVYGAKLCRAVSPAVVFAPSHGGLVSSPPVKLLVACVVAVGSACAAHHVVSRLHATRGSKHDDEDDGSSSGLRARNALAVEPVSRRRLGNSTSLCGCALAGGGWVLTGLNPLGAVLLAGSGSTAVYVWGVAAAGGAWVVWRHTRGAANT